MSLKPKSAVFQVRLDPELLEIFQAQCSARHYTVSDVIRRMIQARSDDWAGQEQRLAKAEEKARQANAYGAVHVGTQAPEKMPTSPVKTLTRAQIKKQERIAQGRK